ncbi:MAG: hypothetical protein IJQ90_03780 [Alphaproteobacteria bacterium]|nr:hypothetical protein [Alphaproteobacteria bacterium]
MAMNMKDFLEKVFKIQRMKEWRVEHPEQWQQLSDWAGSGDPDTSKLNADQRKWLAFLERTGLAATDPFVREPNTKNGFLKIKDFPPISDLSESDWKQLFLTCQSTFARLKANKSSYHGDVQDFVTDNGPLFDDVTDETMEASPRTDAAILALIRKMDKLDNADLYNIFGISKGEIAPLVESRNPGTNEVTAVKKDYNKKKDIRDKIKGWAEKILSPENATKKARLESCGFDEAFIFNANRIDLIVDDYYGWHIPEVSPAKLTDFKTKYSDYLTEIYKSDKILEAYKSCESENKIVSNSIEKAKKDIDYDDTNSKNYVPRKLDEKLTLVEQIQKWAGDTYEDYFKKYKELRGVQIYHHASEVKSILKQIDKAKIKTTDPLSKLVENADNITKALGANHPEAAGAFEWFGKALKEINAKPNMSKVMEKALKSGQKMNDLVSELIIMAAEDGKPETVKKAEIALEVLTTIKYGNTTSKIMDNLKEDKELFTLFSNKDLSWNKNEGVKFVTTAMDKTFRVAFMGLGYGATIAVNRFRRFGTKFNGRLKNTKMRQAHEDWAAKRGAERLWAIGAHGADTANAPVPGAIDIRSEYKRSLDKNTKKRDDALVGLGGMGAPDSDVFIEDQQRDLNTIGRGDEDDKRAKLRPYESMLERLELALRLRHELNELNAAMGGAPSDKQAELKKQLDDIGAIDLTLVGGGAAFDPSTASEAVIEAAIHGVQTNPVYGTYQDDYNDIVNANAEKQQYIDDYRKATKEIREAEKRIDERKKRLDKLTKNDVDGKPMDIYKHLMGYWDTLQDPKLRRYGLRRASKIQANNDTLVQDLFREKMADYTLR